MRIMVVDKLGNKHEIECHDAGFDNVSGDWLRVFQRRNFDDDEIMRPENVYLDQAFHAPVQFIVLEGKE